MTKKRTRDSKSVMSEFKGGDLNKYTARSYAIQNGNEVFGGRFRISAAKANVDFPSVLCRLRLRMCLSNE